jgi:hypothetical protein
MKFIHLDEICETKLAESGSGRLLQTSDFRDRAQGRNKLFTPGVAPQQVDSRGGSVPLI